VTEKKHHSTVVYARKLEVVSKKVAIAEGESDYLNAVIKSPEDVFALFRRTFENQPVEIFLVIHLKSNNGVGAFEIVTKGTLNSSLVHPREVFRAAIIQNAASLILAHNHPSGNPEPSAEDVSITRQLVESGRLLGIPVHDHIIFADEVYTSFAERGLI
jgi:DNA repair protein RadC